MRHCWQCGTPIERCDGGVSAGDLMKFLEGKLPAEKIRETCGKCVLRRDLAIERGEPPPFPLPSEVPTE